MLLSEGSKVCLVYWIPRELDAESSVNDDVGVGNDSGIGIVEEISCIKDVGICGCSTDVDTSAAGVEEPDNDEEGCNDDPIVDSIIKEDVLSGCEPAVFNQIIDQ